MLEIVFPTTGDVQPDQNVDREFPPTAFAAGAYWRLVE